MKNQTLNLKTAASSALLTLALAGTAQASLLGVADLGEGYRMGPNEEAGKAAEHKCGEGKCGGDAAKSAEGKCGEGKCGGAKKAGEGKCGEGKCGGDKKAGEGKCGEGKCGGAA